MHIFIAVGIAYLRKKQTKKIKRINASIILYNALKVENKTSFSRGSHILVHINSIKCHQVIYFYIKM